MWMKHRTVVESSDYTEALGALGDLKRLDDVLAGVYWAMATRPEHYQPLLATKKLRVVKTDGYGDTPSLRVFFTIDEDGERVHALYVEEYDGTGS